jgi:hypothetical protein
MVDRGARDELGRAIRRLVAGLITNDQFQDGLSACVLRSRDLGVQSVRSAAWGLYDDLHEHRLEGRYAIGKTGRRLVAHWILFLKSDLEYEWPNLVGWRRLVLALPNLLTVGAIGRLVRWWHDRRGRASAWPFIRTSDLHAAELAWPKGAGVVPREL